MRKPRILVVEDEAIVAKDIQNTLQKLGYTVLALAYSGEDAVKKAELGPDLVLMDISLKGKMDGIEAADLVHSRLGIPIVFLTGYTNSKTIERAKKTKHFGYLAKPFEARELKAAVEMALAKHKQIKQSDGDQQSLVSILRSSAHAVISTDKNGIITFFNPTAEAITGWRSLDALGKPLFQVFEILDETSIRSKRLFLKCLKEGAVINLRGITLLSKNGLRIPICDGMAPLKDDQDHICGVVLIFHEAGKGTPQKGEGAEQTAFPDRFDRQKAARLTAREIEILRLMAQGLKTRIITSRLAITPNTMRTHVQHILKKFNVHSKVEAIVIAIEQNLNQSPPLSKD